MLKIIIKYDKQVIEFEGEPKEVLQAIISFIEKILPTYKIAKEIIYNIDTEDLIKIIKPYVLISESGDIILTDQGDTLSISNKILTVLIATKLMYLLKIRKNDFLTLNEIAILVSASPKSTSSRLSELYNKGYIEKYRGDEGVKYRISLKGIFSFQRKLL